MCRINPKIDFAFKKLFGSEENKDLLLSLVNSILSEKDQVSELEIKNPYNFADYSNDKFSIVDIKAKDKSGKWINIEMQMNYYSDFDKTALYYWAKIFSDQIDSGQDAILLDKTISINLLDFDYLQGEHYHKVYGIYEKTTKETNVKRKYKKDVYEKIDGIKYKLERPKGTFENLFELHFIELPRFKKTYKEIATTLERWVAFLNRAYEIDKHNIPETLAKEKEIVKAINAIDLMFNEEERAKYQQRQDAKLKHITEQNSIRKEALEIGQTIGEAIGMEKGMEKGRLKEKELIIITMHKKGMAVEMIGEYMNISKEEVQKIISGNK